MDKSKEKRLSYQSYTTFVLVTIITILVSYTNVIQKRNYLANDEKFHLETIAAFKAKQFDNWIKERCADADALTSNTNLIQRIHQVVLNPQDISSIEFIRSRFEAYIKFKSHKAVFLIDPTGEILVEEPETIEILHPDIVSMALNSIQAKKAIPGEFIYCEYHSEQHLDIYVPIFLDYLQKENPIAVMVFRTDSRKVIEDQIVMYPFPTATAESFLIKAENDSIHIFTPTRLASNDRMNLMYPITKQLRKAINNENKFPVTVEDIDYHGRNSYHAIMPLTYNDWYLVSKIEVSEAVSPLRIYILRSVGFSLGILLLTMTGILLIIGSYKSKRLSEKFQEELDRQALMRHFEYIVKYANDIIYMADEHERIVQHNDSALKFYGYSKSEFEELPASKLIEPMIFKHHKETYSYSDYQKGVVMETQHVTKDGRVVPVEASIRAIDIEGERYYQCIIRDISDRKAAETEQNKLHQEIRILNQSLESKVASRTNQLQKAYKDLESFSYSVSHDLRAPLRSVKRFSQALIEDAGEELKPDAIDHLNRIIAGCNTMQQIIDSLMELSGIASKVLHLENIDVSLVINTILAELIVQNSEQRIRSSVPSGISVVGDPALVQTALTNLLSNAIKFSALTPETVITVNYDANDEFHSISISDNGVGFDMKYADKICEPFQRLHSADVFPGSGIGLSIVKRVMQKHGGNIRIFSEPGSGTTTFLDFPKVELQDEYRDRI